LPRLRAAVRRLRQRLQTSPNSAGPVAAAEPAKLRKGPQGLAWRSPALPRQGAGLRRHWFPQAPR